MGKKKIGMEIVNPNAAGIDVGSRSHFVAIGQRKEDVKEYGVYADDNQSISKWLKENNIKTVAMESTGNYWQNLFSALQEAGFEVLLANGKFTKNIKGKKTDVQDCQWIDRVHQRRQKRQRSIAVLSATHHSVKHSHGNRAQPTSQGAQRADSTAHQAQRPGQQKLEERQSGKQQSGLIDRHVLNSSVRQVLGDVEMGALVGIPAGVIGVICQAQVSSQGQDQEQGDGLPCVKPVWMVGLGRAHIIGAVDGRSSLPRPLLAALFCKVNDNVQRRQWMAHLTEQNGEFGAMMRRMNERLHEQLPYRKVIQMAS